ncbi:rano class II histocompatibility A beta chain-like protein [Labeo rohita]|uniref:Rano class II histocompatibility A beta chain-like protein n=1 Tax=Labeo rohita TaxID=84645 RepID=A0A498MES5_LABRO|nr:rano class II histocompatibility A beta chain-like protein [Labeo rohita]
MNLIMSTVKPEVIVRTVRQACGKIPAMLICSAYDFYPKPIKLTWMRDDKEMTADVTSTEELADGDWYYQIHSHLEYFPKPGEKISCVVEHASSNKPMIYDLGPSLSESDRNKLITGAAGLVLGLIMAVGGLIYCKRKHTVKPEVINRSIRQASSKIPAMLICSAYDFYPKPIKLTWMRDDKEMTADVTSTEELADGDWYYQIHSNLEYFPKPGEKISCVLEHASSNKAMIYDLVKPEVIIRSDREARENEKAVLVCSAYDFYPKPIKITWMRDDIVMTADMTSTEELADGDWHYQIHSHLEYFPKPGEKISCVVEHASSNKPMIYHWGKSFYA